MTNLELSILVLIFIGQAVHHYLDIFFDLKMLPYSRAFSLFVNVFALAYALNFIWMFGIGFGLLFAVVCYFGILHSTILWVFQLPTIYRMMKKPETVKVNCVIHTSHAKIAIAVGILGIINIFISPYAHLTKQFSNYTDPLLALLAIVVIGNVLRMITVLRYEKAQKNNQGLGQWFRK